MIFVTVGTHEQQFNRLVKAVDDLKMHSLLNEKIIVQTGYSNYKPKACIFKPFYPYQQMLEFVNQARIIITHGGPSSIFMALQIGKIPIVVPREKKFNEHVNDHQVDFCRKYQEKKRNILLVEDIDQLGNSILNYESVTCALLSNLQSNNESFCSDLSEIVNTLFLDK